MCLYVCVRGWRKIVGPIVTKLGMDLEWGPGQVNLGSKVTSPNRKWRHWTGNGLTPLQNTQFWSLGKGIIPSPPNLPQNLTDHQRLGMRVPEVTYPNRKWYHKTESGAILGPRKLRLHGNLAHNPNTDRRESRWHKWQPEDRLWNRKWPHQTGSEVILGLRKLQSLWNLSECIRITHRGLRRPCIQLKVTLWNRKWHQ